MRIIRSGKALLLSIVLLLIVLFCISCDPGSIFLDSNELKEHCISAELIYYNNPEAKIITDVNLLKSYDFDKEEKLNKLSDEYLEEFFSDLSKVEFFAYFEFSQFADSANGICLKLVYDDNRFILLSSQKYDDEKFDIAIKFDSNGEIIDTIGLFSWHSSYLEIIDKYFDV